MSDYSFSETSGVGQPRTLIPAATLAWATIHFVDRKVSKNGGDYAKVELVIQDGEFAGRRVYSVLMNPYDVNNRDSSKPVDAAKMAITAITRMCETSGIFVVGNPESYKLFNGKAFNEIIAALNGQRVAFKVGIKKGTDGYDDSNTVADFLSPNKDSGGYKDFAKLTGGNASEARSNAFQVPAPQVRTAQAPQAGAAPGWLKTPNSNNPF